MLFKSIIFFSFIIITISCIRNVNCWESYELDLFDLVEEVGKNFYDVLGVDPKCDSNDIKKAYRKLSLQYHPDKNPDPNAETIFRQIVAINEVLKDSAKRARYDQILEFGMPDWRQPIYYYRRAKKMSFLEIAVTLSVIISIGHYFVMWAQYFETRLTWGERIDEARKRIEKKAKKTKNKSEFEEIDSNLQKIYDSIPAPTLQRTLPCRLAVFLFNCATVGLPWLAKVYYRKYFVKKKPEPVQPEEEMPQVTTSKRDTENLHKQLNPQKIEKSNLSKRVLDYERPEQQQQQQQQSPTLDAENSLEWTEKQKSDLIKAIAKFPAGTIDRWNKIAEFVGRPVKQCIQMEKLAKSNFFSAQQSANMIKKQSSADNDNTKVKSTTSNDTTESNNIDTTGTAADKWTQEEQSLLENALKEFKKELGPERWERIAEKVGSKTKEQCINRFKALCASLKKT